MSALTDKSTANSVGVTESYKETDGIRSAVGAACDQLTGAGHVTGERSNS